mgnify:CR=1 FL=1
MHQGVKGREKNKTGLEGKNAQQDTDIGERYETRKNKHTQMISKFNLKRQGGGVAQPQKATNTYFLELNKKI